MPIFNREAAIHLDRQSQDGRVTGSVTGQAYDGKGSADAMGLRCLPTARQQHLIKVVDYAGVPKHSELEPDNFMA